MLTHMLCLIRITQTQQVASTYRTSLLRLPVPSPSKRTPTLVRHDRMLSAQSNSMHHWTLTQCINNTFVRTQHHTRNLCTVFNPSKVHTHSSEHTHHEHTHPEHCGARGTIEGSLPCSRAPQLWYWRWRERCTYTPPTYNSCRTWDSNAQPLDYESDSLTIRPRLPPLLCHLPQILWK